MLFEILMENFIVFPVKFSVWIDGFTKKNYRLDRKKRCISNEIFRLNLQIHQKGLSFRQKKRCISSEIFHGIR